MKVLVLTSEPITSEQLRAALPGEVDPQRSEVMIVAPALQRNPLKFWLSDADEAIARAEEVWRQSVEQLRADGVAASGDTGESDPMLAVQDAIMTFPAERIVLFTHGGDSGGYREDVDVQELRERFGVPIEQAQV